MGRVVVTTNVTLDGISEDPTGEEDFKLGGWFLQISESDRAAWARATLDEAREAAAILMGARSYAWFAPRWVGREGDMAEILAALPKYVVRTHAGRDDWGPTTVIDGNVVEAVAKLRSEADGDVLVYASYQLVRALLEHELVDEVRLVLFPHALGSGGRLFHHLVRPVALHLTGVERVGDELVRLSYEVPRS